MSAHAYRRMQRRKVSEAELAEALEDPLRRAELPLLKNQFKKRFHIVGRNKVIVIVAVPNTIVTVYRYNPEYAKSKRKEKSNQTKREYANRRRKRGARN